MLHVGGRVGIGEFDPGNAADDVGAERHGLMHQLGGAGFAHDAVLGEGDHLNIDDAAEFVAHADERLDGLETRLAVNVGKGADVQVAVQAPPAPRRGERSRRSRTRRIFP